jgi:hypothetical protein
MTIPLLIQIRRLPSLTISPPASVSTNLWQFGLTTAWESPNFQLLNFGILAACRESRTVSRAPVYHIL